MNQDQEFLDQLDRYAAGQLSVEDRLKIEEKMAGDPLLRKKAEEHREFVAALKFFGQRKSLKESLDQIHKEVAEDSPIITMVEKGFFRRHWPMIAVAASVAIISITGTMVTLNSLEKKQAAYYKEMVRKVDQFQKSVRADLKVSKQKVDPFAGKYTGTGFLISPAGFIATSYHVIKGADSVYVQNEQFGGIKTEIIFSDPANDVAILKIPDSLFKSIRSLPFSISPDEANIGESVFTLGFPREDIVYGEGSVSASSGYRQNTNAYQVSVPVNPGNSGGPLMNEKGDVIGIISGIQTETSGAAFAIKSRILLDVIKEVPDSLKIGFTLPRQSHLKNANKVQQVKKWKDFVFIVKVYNK